MKQSLRTLTRDSLQCVTVKDCLISKTFGLTFTLVVKTTAVIIIDHDHFVSIGTDRLLNSGTGSKCHCDIAIDAGCCGTVATLPGLSILNQIRKASQSTDESLR